MHLLLYSYICLLITSLFLHCKVTIDLELHLNKNVKLKPSKGPVAHYDVFLYKMPNTKPHIANGPSARTVNGPSKAKGRVLKWEDALYPPSSPCSICNPISTPSLPASITNEQKGYRTWILNPYNPWWTVPCTFHCHIENGSVNVHFTCFWR